MTILLVYTFSLSSIAASEEGNIYNIGNITVVFDENNNFDTDTREALAHMLASGNYDNGNIATYNLLCTLFGHKYETTGVTTITHCVEPDQPRCLEECFTVQVCSRCEDRIVERTGFRYITCCP